MQKWKFGAVVSAVVVGLVGCGGGGSSQTDNSSISPRLIAGTTNTVAPSLQANGSYNVYSEKSFRVSCFGSCDISVEGLVNATRSDLGQQVTGYTEYIVTLKITDLTKSASAVITATSTADRQNAKTFNLNILPSAAEALPVKLNGSVATVDANGEYKITTGTRITIEDSQNRLTNVSSATVNSTGVSVFATQGIHVMSASMYDITWSNGPSGGLTTITFSRFDPAVVIKLRWQ